MLRDRVLGGLRGWAVAAPVISQPNHEVTAKRNPDKSLEAGNKIEELCFLSGFRIVSKDSFYQGYLDCSGCS